MVSIIIPNYNNGKYLKDCIDSCKSQAYKDIEIIVVDDASTDGSKEILSSIEGIKTILFEQNSGVSKARNEGIKAASGEYVLPLDADDMLTEKSITSRIVMLESGIEAVYGFMLKVHGDISYKDALAGNWERHPSDMTVPVYNKNVFKKYGLFHEPLRSKEDKEMSYRLGVHKKSPLKNIIKFDKVSSSVIFYRRHENAKRKRRVTDLMFDIYTCMEFDKRMKDLEINGITSKNTEFLV